MGWALTQYDWHPYKNDNLDPDVRRGKMTEETERGQPSTRRAGRPGTDPSLTGFRRNQSCWHLDFECLASRTETGNFTAVNAYTNKEDPIKRQAKDLDRYFSKGDIKIVNEHIKKCSISLIIRETRIETTVDITSYPSGWLLSKKNENKKYWRGCRNTETPVHHVGGAKWYSCCGKLHASSSKH